MKLTWLILLIPTLAIADDNLLISAGKQIKVRSITTGQTNEVLERFARASAEVQADSCHQGHMYWMNHYQNLFHDLPRYYDFHEIVSESWPGQNKQEGAADAYRSWRFSGGHWGVANGDCDIYGCALAQGSNGIWYSCMITAKKRK